MVNGGTIGPYTILAKLGEGGMGEVYRACDTKLNRDVAIKVLPEAFALDADRLARFTREAQVLASLNHPNIAGIYGIEEQGSIRALVMELVEGEDLSARIARGPIPVDEALPIAKQIAEALEAAHEQGVIHRDLKPANIKVRADSTVKVLDFGLAKAIDQRSGIGDQGSGTGGGANSPTITTPAMTMRGVILGTAAYMSPEQAKGKAVDKRADIWAFGVVLFEMLAGARAFEGDDLSEVMASVLKLEPNWRRLPADLPDPVRRLLKRCLEKDPKNRLRDIADGWQQLDDAVAGSLTFPASGVVTPMAAPASLWRRTLPWVFGAAGLGAAMVSIAVWAPWHSAAPPQVMRFSLLPAPPMVEGTAPFNTVAISPDGKLVAYVAEGGALVIRPIDQLNGQPLPGIRNVRAPFFSPDGLWVGYFEGPSVLKKVSVSGGAAVTLCACGGVPRGASWGDDHTIVFASAATDTGLWSVPDSGGEPKLLSRPDLARGEIDHLHPFVLPGSRSVLFTVAARPITDSQIAVLDRATGTSKIVVRGGSRPIYVDPGVIIYGASGALFSVRFDAKRLEVIGSPVPLAEQVAAVSNLSAQFSISATGTFVYAPGGFQSQEIGTQGLVWIDRNGRTTPVKGAPARAYHMLRLSPDGTKVALGIRDQENDVWVWDLVRETMSRLTVDSGFDTDAVWAPDGRRIAFSGTQGGAVASIFWQAADGTGIPDRLTSGRGSPTSFSPDGKFLVFRADSGLHTLAMDSRQSLELLKTQGSDRSGELSPDGRFIAYEWTQSDTTQIYVQPFPNLNGGRWQVSQAGGRKPAWSASGRELYYIGASGGLYSVPVQTTSAGFSSGNPIRLFDLSDLGNSYNGRPYDPTRDGQQFIALRPAGSPTERAAQPLAVVVNWIEEVKAKLGIAR